MINIKANWRLLSFAAALIPVMLTSVAGYAAGSEDDNNPAFFFAKYGPSPTYKTSASYPAGVKGSVADMVTAAAQRHGVPVNVAHAIARVESKYNCGARSVSNARGVMQVLPRTAAFVGVSGSLYDCQTGIEAGMRYLALIVRGFGTSCAALSLYEMGIAARPRCTRYGRMVVAKL